MNKKTYYVNKDLTCFDNERTSDNFSVLKAKYDDAYALVDCNFKFVYIMGGERKQKLDKLFKNDRKIRQDKK